MPIGFITLACFRARLHLQCDLAALRDIDLELLIQHDGILLEVVTHPELARSVRRGGVSGDAVLEHLARTQRRYGHVLLACVGVEGSLALDRARQLLYRVA